MEDNKVKIACDSLRKVGEYKKCKNFGRAFAHYMVYLELTPGDRSPHEKQFSELLSAWCMVLEDRRQFEDLYKCYLQGLHYFPLSIEILNNFGAHLLRLEQELQAKKYLQLAHNLDKDYLPAEKNLSTVKQCLIPRWHFRMLNDYKRNKMYLDAINATIDQKYNRILDIGTGCGLLSLCASRNVNTARIVAVEESHAMTEITRDVFRVNDLKNVNLIQKNSNELSSTDVQKSNVLITEIFDAGLFGEHALETLIHAHENLLEADCRIVPASADVYITGIECFEMYRQHAFVNSDLKHLIFKNLCVKRNRDEPYEAENIENYDFLRLTETVKFLTVNFGDLDQLKRLFGDRDFIGAIELDVKSDGDLHAFVIWFDLRLNERAIITTDPFGENNCKCWEQSVVYLEHPIRKKVGDVVKARVSYVNDMLEIIADSGVDNCNCFGTRLGTIEFLNDKALLENIEMLSEHFLGDNLIVLDLFPVPIFGLHLAARNSHVFTLCSDEDLVKQICTMNGINVDNITFITEDELFKYLECKHIFDIIFFDPVSERNGTLNERFYSNFHLFGNSLKENGLILPQSVRIDMRIIESDYLFQCNKVNDENLFGFKIADYINEYSVSEHWQLDNHFKYKSLSETVSGNISLDSSSVIQQSFDTIITDDGKPNSIIYWYTINFFNNITYTTSNSTYYKRACFLFENKRPVQKGDRLDVSMKQHKGLVKLQFI